jgi:DNA-binding NarL/FixJ family response regulator
MSSQTTAPSRTIRVLLADDHSILRHGLRAMLEKHPEFVVVGEAGDGRETVRLATETEADVIVMDVAMPVMNGVEATRRITQQLPDCAVVMLSMYNDESYVLRALRAGAKGYLLKDSAQVDLIDAIRSVAAGRAFFSPAVSKLLREDYISHLQARGIDDSYELLSDREREILQLIGEGRSNKEVANLLNLSLYTVETHRSHILQKLNIHSIPELVLYAVRKGIVR